MPISSPIAILLNVQAIFSQAELLKHELAQDSCLVKLVKVDF